MKRDGPSDLFVSQRSALIDYATPIVGDRSRAEDIVQEAFIRFTRAADGQASVEQPVAYLFRIVRNLAFDWRRRRQIEQRQEKAEPEWWMIPEMPQTPEQKLIQDQSFARIEAILETFPPQTRMAIRLCRFEGFTVAEAGERLGMSGSTVSRLIAKAMGEIVSKLNEDDESGAVT